jgi:uncharacterized protein
LVDVCCLLWCDSQFSIFVTCNPPSWRCAWDGGEETAALGLEFWARTTNNNNNKRIYRCGGIAIRMVISPSESLTEHDDSTELPPLSSLLLSYNDTTTELKSWQENWLYLAPSKHGTGWGVFAAKSFDKGDIIEVAPLFLRFAEEEPLMKESILDNYHYEYWKWDGYGHVAHTVLSFGYTLFYNHGEEQNIKYFKWGDDPTLHNPEFVAAVGYYAKRDIAVGEELLCTYGGSSWFEQRELYMVDPTVTNNNHNDTTNIRTTTSLPNDNDNERWGEENTNPNENGAAQQQQQLWVEDEEWRELYTSKIYSGFGKTNFKALLQSLFDDKSKRKYDMKSYYKTRVAPFEAGYRNSRAKVTIDREGTLLEIAPALIVAKEIVCNTLLEPIALFWNDLDPSSLDEEGSYFAESLRILYKNNATQWLPRYKKLRRDEATALLPLGGSLALLDRTTSDNPNDYNCRLEGIMPDRSNEHAFTIRIVSTKSIEMGERLVLKMGGISSSIKTRQNLWVELVETGQPLPPNSKDRDVNGHNYVNTDNA